MSDEWESWRNHILFELERIAKKIDEVHNQHQEVHAQITQEITALKTTHKVNSAWFGFLSGFLGAAVAFAFDLFRK